MESERRKKQKRNSKKLKWSTAEKESTESRKPNAAKHDPGKTNGPAIGTGNTETRQINPGMQETELKQGQERKVTNQQETASTAEATRANKKPYPGKRQRTGDFAKPKVKQRTNGKTTYLERKADQKLNKEPQILEEVPTNQPIRKETTLGSEDQPTRPTKERVIKKGKRQRKQRNHTETYGKGRMMMQGRSRKEPDKGNLQKRKRNESEGTCKEDEKKAGSESNPQQ